MSTPFLDPRRSEPQAHANPVLRAAWKRSALTPRASREAPCPDPFRRLEDRQFLEMDSAFGTRGGWISGDEMARRLRRQWSQPISVLANWVTKREIVNIAWHSAILIPVFQFGSQDLQIRPVVQAVLAELGSVFDDWEIAVWFAQPNAWLNQQRPLDLAASDDAAVIDAARADRFIAHA
jgi:hypothetical protein